MTRFWRQAGFAAVLCAVALPAAYPAMAQQNPAAASRPGGGAGVGAQSCPDGSAPRPDRAGDPCPSVVIDPSLPGGFAVILPDILVDLFGDPVAGRPQSQPGDDRGSPPLPTPNPRTSEPAGPPAMSDGVAAPVQLSTAPPTVPPEAISGDFVPDEVLVTLAGGAPVAAEIAAAYGLDIRSLRESALLGGTVARLGIPDGRPVGVVLAQLAAEGRLLRRVPNHVYSLQQAATIVNYAFERIALDTGAASGADVGVAVIDTAVDETHPALSGAIADIYDAMPDTPVVGRDHGTSVAGLIAGAGPFKGIAPGAVIHHARAFEGGRSTMDIILDAFDWAAGRDVRIVNMSFVGPKNDLMELACASAMARGMILVAAAGNNGPNAPYGYPAAYDGVIAVTATDEKDQLMRQANRGPYVFVSAPGVDMMAPVAGGTDLVTGTSFAAAIVSGAVANLLHADPGRGAEWVAKALSETAVDLGDAGRDSDFGFGLINAKAAGAR